MKLPKAAVMMLTKPISSMALQAYQQGKKDFEEGNYDEDSFKKQFKAVIKKNL